MSCQRYFSKFLWGRGWNFKFPTANSISGCRNPLEVKLLIRVWLGLCHLCEHKLKHSFQDTLNPPCSGGKEVETAFYFLLSCLNYSDKRLILLSKIRNVNPSNSENTNSEITQFFIYGDKNFTASNNSVILYLTIEYILATKRFYKPLFLKRSPFLITFHFSILFFPLYFLTFTLSPRYDSLFLSGDCKFLHWFWMFTKKKIICFCAGLRPCETGNENGDFVTFFINKPKHTYKYEIWLINFVRFNTFLVICQPKNNFLHTLLRRWYTSVEKLTECGLRLILVWINGTVCSDKTKLCLVLKKIQRHCKSISM